MTAIAAAGRKFLPRGWGDLGRQLLIWFGFLAAYQVVRGFADRNPTAAFANGLRVIDIEQRAHTFYELTFQHVVDSSHTLSILASITYWNSEFTVVGLALLWMYLRRNESFVRFRNWILAANIIGLFGYIFLPTAPPRMFPGFGFADTLGGVAGLNHGSGLVQLAANPYAAMPSLHAADALIVGVSLALVVRSWWAKAFWVAWPLWVWFCVMATANHFLLDVCAGIFVALIAAAALRAPGVVAKRRALRATA
jgi:hypothetical protein